MVPFRALLVYKSQALWLGALGGAGPRERVGLVALYPWLYGLPGALWRLSGLLVAQSSLQNTG